MFKNRFEVSKLLFLLSTVSIVFAYGAAVGRYRIFPFSALSFGFYSAQQVLQQLPVLMGTRPQPFLQLARHEGSGVTHWNEDYTAPGLTLMAGLFAENTEIRLITHDGVVVRRWPVRFSELFPDVGHIQPLRDRPNTNWNTEIHGALALPDGSVVFNFEYKGLVKLDRCGAVRWTVPLMTHHSIERSSDGGFWVGGRRYVEGLSQFPPLMAPHKEDTVLRISDNGEVLAEFSVPQIFFASNLEYLLLATGAQSVKEISDGEIVHLNDIEELPDSLADRFPAFAAGDLMLSLRNLNLIMIVDPKTQQVKWQQTGPWIRQHDPDFRTDGTISVFNNNTDGTDSGSVLGGSNIVVMNPEDRKAVVWYGAEPGQEMYTPVQGKHQTLPNGNTLITESLAGRAFEITEKRDIVWEFVNRYDDAQVARVNDAIRYPEGYFTVEDWQC